MCGRYVSVNSDQDLTSEFDIEEVVGDQLSPSWNVAPTDPVRVVVKRHPTQGRDAAPIRQLRTVKWGLVPSWSRTRTGGTKMINARSETVARKPAFTAAAARRRCLAPSLGYFEWQHDGGRKIPYFLHAPDESTLAMAGLYEIWHDDSLPDDDPNAWLWTSTIITRPASDALGHLHERCPVVIPPDLYDDWLDCTDDDPDTARQILDQVPAPRLEPRLVCAAVGNVRNNGPERIRPVITEAPDTPIQLCLDDVTAKEEQR